MQKGMTLIELVFILFLLSLCLTLSLSSWHYFNDKRQLNLEQQRLYLFLRYIQARSENSMHSFSLFVSKNNKKWCLFSQKEKSNCNCFSPKQCNKEALFYYPYFSERIELDYKYDNWIPITVFGAIQKNSQAKCFVLRSGDERVVFSFSNTGDIRVKSGEFIRSGCLATRD